MGSKRIRKKDHVEEWSEITGMHIKPTLPPVTLYKMALYYREKAKIARVEMNREKRERKKVMGEKFKPVPRGGSERVLYTKVNRSDLVDLYLMAHIAYEAMTSLKMKVGSNAFLHLAILSYVSQFTSVKHNTIAVKIKSYRRISKMNAQSAIILAKMREQGLLDSTGSADGRVYYITSKGKDQLKAARAAFNVVLSRGWKETENLVE